MIRGVSHPIMFDRSKRTTIILEDKEMVEKYLRILILTAVGEFVISPRYGCNLKSLLFNNNNSALVDLCRDSIATAIRNYAKSIVVEYNDISIIQIDNRVGILVNYTMNNSFEKYSMELEISNIGEI